MRTPAVATCALLTLAALGLTSETGQSRSPEQEEAVNLAVDPVDGQIPDRQALGHAASATIGTIDRPASLPPSFSPTPSQSSDAAQLTDVVGHKAQPAIEALLNMGIVQGFTDGSFRPDAVITPDHLAILIQKAIQHKGADFWTAYLQQVAAAEPDAAQLQTWTALTIAFKMAAEPTFTPEIVGWLPENIAQQKALTGKEQHQTAKFGSSLTRAEAAIFIYQALEAGRVVQSRETAPVAQVTQPVAQPVNETVNQQAIVDVPDRLPTQRTAQANDRLPPPPAKAAGQSTAQASLPAPPPTVTVPVLARPQDDTPKPEDPTISPPTPKPPVIDSQLPTFTQVNRSEELVNYWTALCKQNPQNTAEALAACDQLVVVNPNDATTWVARGNLLLNLEKYTEAIASYQRALKLDAEQSQVWLNLCRAHSETGQQKEAIAACDQALQVNKNWRQDFPARAWYYRGVALKRLGQNEQAIASYDKALAEVRTYSLALTDKCRALSELGNQQAAIDTCNLAIAADGDWGAHNVTLAWHNLGLALSRAKRFEDAIVAYNEILAINPKDANAWTHQGILLAKVRRPFDALTAYDQAIKLSPTFSLALVNRCAVLNQLGRYEEALANCEQAMNGDGRWSDTDPAYVWDQRSQALAGLNRLEEALAAANRAVTVTPSYAEAWSNQGVVLWRLQRYREALAAAEKAVKLEPTYAQGWYNQGRILRSLERNEAAIVAYDKALLNSTDTTTPIAREDIWANRSAVLWHLGYYQEALKSADNAIGINPNSGAGWYNRGVALIALEKPGEALRSYDKAIQINPQDAYAHVGRGIALNLMGRYEEALIALDEALKIMPNQTLALQSREIIQLKLAAAQTSQPHSSR